MAIIVRPIEEREMREVEKIIDTMFSTNMSTLCDHIRQVYKLSKDSPEIRDLCKRMMVYAKRMDNALKASMGVSEYYI